MRNAIRNFMTFCRFFGGNGGSFLVAAALLCIPGTANANDQSDALHKEIEIKAGAVLAIAGDPAYGEYLGGECVTCHLVSGASEGIPPIAGLPKDYFITTMLEYKTGIRPNEVMKSRVERLSDEELAALAEYFSNLQAN